MNLTQTDIARFWSKVSVGGPDECWLWQASTNRARWGYGQFGARVDGKRRLLRAHRVAFALERGAVPAGMFVLHSCDTPACCNPMHLRAGTAAENTRDAMNRGRWKARVPVHGRTHGIPSTYSHGCRCAPCKDADKAYRRSRRQKVAA